MTQINKQRLQWVDVLRGIAILFMIPANLSTLWENSHPMWFRLMGSFAAPTFILLSTAMVFYNSSKHSLKYYVERGLIILSVGIMIDLFLWKMLPFMSYDILYFIGLSLPIAYLVRKFPAKILLTIGFAILVTTPFLENFIGYYEKSLEVEFAALYAPSFLRVLQSFFVDGWFPIFPWLSLTFFSIVIFRYLFSSHSFEFPRWLILGGSLSLLGMIFLFLPNHFFANLANGGIIENREGYSEIFYRPTLAFFCLAMGVFMWLLSFSQYISHYSFSRFIAFFGKYSLLIYILHQVIGQKIILAYLKSQGRESITSGVEFFYWVMLTIILVAIFCNMIELLKKFYRPRSIFLQVLIGK